MTTILLVPNDPASRLLAPGKAGAMPPRAWLTYGPDPIWRMGDPMPGTPADRDAPRALVLALDGEPVPEGVDRAARVLRGHGWWSDTPRRLRCWASGDFTATYLIDPRAPVRVVVIGD